MAGTDPFLTRFPNRFYPTNANDMVLTSFTYAPGALGGYYQSSTNLCDMGSRNATNAALYQYTVRLFQTKQLKRTLVIGVLYVPYNPADSEVLQYTVSYIEPRLRRRISCAER